jgi:arylsulfatase A-like enzyme
VLPYEEALRQPLLVRGPGIAPGSVRDELVGNIDLAPTIAEIAHVTPARIVDGVSLLELMKTGRWSVDRDDIVVEGGPFDKASQEFVGLRTSRYQFSVYGNGEEELYDLQADPYELENRAGDPSFFGIRAELTARLERLRLCSGVTCRP